MTTNKLKLNDDKTEALLFSRKTTSVSLPQSVHVGDVDISFAPSARNLGFMITSDMSLDKHVSTMCKSAYYELRKLSAIRHYLSTHTAVTLVCAFVLSRLDYCNALLSGCPQYLINKLQRVQNSAARLIFQARKHDHVTPLLRSLHWLPVQARIEYKLSSLCYNFFTGHSPAYMSQLLSPYIPRRQLRSSSDSRSLIVPKINTKTYGARTFSHAAAVQWNSLPHSIRYAKSLSAFKRSLKTYLFNKHLSSDL
jgi:hypothetical protein